jgi:hypothetical protein
MDDDFEKIGLNQVQVEGEKKVVSNSQRDQAVDLKDLSLW